MNPDPLMRGNDLIGKAIVDAERGEDVGEVRDIVFNPAQGRLVGFTLNGRGAFAGRLSTVLPIAAVTSVGTDAVMVSGVAGFSEPDDSSSDEITAARDADNDVVDDLVVTESGRSLGRVRDVIVRGGAQPQVVAFEIDGEDVGAGLIPLADNSGVSSSALIVPDEFEGRVQQDLTGLASELERLTTTRQKGGAS